MKKKDLIIIGSAIILILIVIVILLCKKEPEEIIQNDSFIYMGSYHEDIIENENYIITSYDDYVSKFESDELTKEDFDNNNYAVINVLYDQCSEKDIKPTDYKIEKNNIFVTVKYTASCGVCAPERMYFLLSVDKNIESANIKVDYKAVNKPHCDPNVTYKPLIYLYPTKKMNINVKLGNEKLLTVTYPKYNDSWNVLAYPNGDLILKDGRKYYGLYWEALNYINSDFKDGFVVKGSESAKFLEEKLDILGLNEREANEFIIYWLPKLEENKYNLIRFENIDVINEQMPLIVKPIPDTMIRVLMEFKPLNEKIDINEQVLTKVERKGFTVVEWGGSLIK